MTPMPLFRFALRPLDQVQPWGEPGRLSLHWFGLTDGWSWMDVGSAELFRYTPAAMAHWSIPDAGPLCCYSDYQVIRLWEDLWDVLPDVLEPIPADVMVDTPLAMAAGRQFCQPENDDALNDLLGDASDWWGYPRHLSTLHLQQGPQIRLWRTDDTVHVGWDNRDRVVDGNPVWTADHGVASFAVADFVDHVRDFHARLAAAMRPRVEHVRLFGPPPGVQIDVGILVATQAEWDADLPDPLALQTRTDWDRIRAALAAVRPALA